MSSRVRSRAHRKDHLSGLDGCVAEGDEQVALPERRGRDRGDFDVEVLEKSMTGNPADRSQSPVINCCGR